MRIADLLQQWEASAGGALAAREYPVRLALHDAARIAALAEMYPRRSEREIIAELISAALDELERAMPYVQGEKPVAEDEQGDPVFEDIGPAPRFASLVRKYLKQLEQQPPG